MTRQGTRPTVALACLLLVLLSCAPASAQSGRRPPAARPAPPIAAPTPEPAPERTLPPEPEVTGPKTQISAGKYMSSFNLADSVGSYILGACLKRLGQVPTFMVTPGKDLNRKQAIDLAKSNEESYVLLIDFSLDSTYSDPGDFGPADYRNIVATYIVYAPKTAKVKTQGRIYIDATVATSDGRVLAPYGRARIGSGRGLAPDEGGYKIAEYVMSSFDVPSGPIAIPR